MSPLAIRCYVLLYRRRIVGINKMMNNTLELLRIACVPHVPKLLPDYHDILMSTEIQDNTLVDKVRGYHLVTRYPCSYSQHRFGERLTNIFRMTLRYQPNASTLSGAIAIPV